MRHWLMKTEPTVFSFDDLMKAPGRKTHWEGVRNYQARNLMRDEFRRSDRVLIYHSNTEEPAVVGLAEVAREGYPDTTALDPRSKYFDPKAKGESPWIMVDIRAVAPLTPITRDMLRANRATSGMMVLKRGARLSVQPVTEREFREICRLGGVAG